MNKRNFIKKLVMASVFLLSFLLHQSSYAQQEKISVLAQPFPPYSIQLPSGELSGLGVEIFKIVAEKIGLNESDYEITPASFKRMYVEVKDDKRRVGIAVSRTPQRENLFNWVGPYSSTTHGLIAKKDRQIKIKTIEDLNKYDIATIRNAAPEQALIRSGISSNKLQSAVKPQTNILKLSNDRVDLMAHPIQSVSFIMWQEGVNAELYEMVYKISQPDLYFIFSKDFTKGELEKFDQALSVFKQSDAYQYLVSLYRLNDIEIPIQ